MSIPTQVLEKYLTRFKHLISEGEEIQAAVVTIPGEYYQDVFKNTHQRPPKYRMDTERLVKWKTNCQSLLDQIIPTKSVHKSALAGFGQIKLPHEIAWGISTLRGLADDLENGFLSEISQLIESAIAADYMGQAEGLLNEGQLGKYDHVPAAVLAGAVLEKTLREMCENQVPPIPVLNARGENKTMNPLIDDLKKAGVINEAKAKQLRAWAAIRNHAAHGEFDEFARTDVAQMIQGINIFLSDALK